MTTPERHLWQAVLMRACQDLAGIPDRDIGKHHDPRRVFQNSWDWFDTEDCKEVCENAGIDYRKVVRARDEGVLMDAVLEMKAQRNRYPCHNTA